MQINDTPELVSEQWPNFYAILNASTDVGNDELRRIISDCYQQASSKMDHRDLSVRFYNQVLTQKVLPTCRRILLNPDLRALYDEQLRLHREGATGAVSYRTFVVEVTHTKSTCLLDANELSILPSVDGTVSHAPLQALSVPGVAQQSIAPTAEISDISLEPSVPAFAPAVLPQNSKKSLPLAAIAGIGVLLLGAGGWFLTRSAPATSDPQPSNAVKAATTTSEKKTPPLMKLNTVAGNSDFEGQQANPWVIRGTPGGAFLDNAYNKDAKSGNRVLNFWTKEVPAGQPSKTSRVAQKMTNLENGVYTLKAWMRRSGKQKDFYMFASDYGSPMRKLNIDLSNSSGWNQITLSNINVTNGQCVIGFYCDNVSEWVNVDAVEFYRSS